MERAKLANGSGHELAIARSSPAEQCQMGAARSPGKKTVRKRAAPKKARSVRPLRNRWEVSQKQTCLFADYCGSDDLAPSFIKRRDRRCRKCFSKRYGSAARAWKAKVKK
jgi:hypothetical protein